jgi:iron complex transport system ATP-binding protein
MIKFSFHNVTFSYPQTPEVINNLSVTLHPNQIIVLLGANGVGKSTFLKLCLGFLQPTVGSIYADETDFNSLAPLWFGKNIAYTAQSPIYPYHLSIRDYILLGRTPHLKSYESPKKKDVEIANLILQKLGVSHLAQRTLQEISGGEKQLVSFARTIAQETPCLLLDEVTSDLDIKNSLTVIRILSELKVNHTIIFSTHDPQIAKAIADTLILFKPNHTIEIGEPDDLLTAQHLSSTYQIPKEYIQENPLQILWNRDQ